MENQTNKKLGKFKSPILVEQTSAPVLHMTSVMETPIVDELVEDVKDVQLESDKGEDNSDEGFVNGHQRSTSSSTTPDASQKDEPELKLDGEDDKSLLLKEPDKDDTETLDTASVSTLQLSPKMKQLEDEGDKPLLLEEPDKDDADSLDTSSLETLWLSPKEKEAWENSPRIQPRENFPKQYRGPVKKPPGRKKNSKTDSQTSKGSIQVRHDYQTTATKASVKSFEEQAPRRNSGTLPSPPHCKDARESVRWAYEAWHPRGTWIECCHAACRKWRFVPSIHDPAEVPAFWICSMNPGRDHTDCSQPERRAEPSEQVDLVDNDFTAGSLVWAHLAGYPWWPAIVDYDPDYLVYLEIGNVPDKPVRYHVTFIDPLAVVSRAWLPRQSLKPFRRNLNLKYWIGMSRSASKFTARIEAAKEMAARAANLTLTARLHKFGFVVLYRGTLHTQSSDCLDEKGPAPSYEGQPLVSQEDSGDSSGSEDLFLSRIASASQDVENSATAVKGIVHLKNGRKSTNKNGEVPRSKPAKGTGSLQSRGRETAAGPARAPKKAEKPDELTEPRRVLGDASGKTSASQDNKQTGPDQKNILSSQDSASSGSKRLTGSSQKLVTFSQESSETQKTDSRNLLQQQKKPAKKRKVEMEPAKKRKVEMEPAKKRKVEMEPAKKRKVEMEPAKKRKVEMEPAKKRKVEMEPAKKRKVEMEPAKKRKVEMEPANKHKVEKEPANKPKMEKKPANKRKIAIEGTKSPWMMTRPHNEHSE